MLLKCRKSSTVMEYRSMDLLTTRSLVNICRLARSMWGSVPWSTASRTVWCRSHGLKLNADKSDVIWLGTRQQLSRMSKADKDLHLPSGTLKASEIARNLGVIIDQQLTFDTDARACSRACFYHLRRIRQIRRFVMIGHCGYWSTRLSRHVWTIAMVCLRTAAWPFVNGYNKF